MPRWISERDFAHPQQVGQVNDQDQQGTSKKPMNVLTSGRITLHSAWQDDEARLVPVAEAERIVGLGVALRQRLQASTHQFREIGSRKQAAVNRMKATCAGSSLSMLTPGGMNSGNFTLAVYISATSGTQGINST